MVEWWFGGTTTVDVNADLRRRGIRRRDMAEPSNAGNGTWAPPDWTRSAAAFTANVGRGLAIRKSPRRRTSVRCSFPLLRSIVLSRWENESGSGFQHVLKLTELIIRQSDERRVAVKPRYDEWHDERLSSEIGECSVSDGGQRSSWTRFWKRASSWRRRRPGRSRDHGPKIQAELNRSILRRIWCWRLLDAHQRTSQSVGAGYSPSTMTLRRHTQIPAPAAAILLMDCRTRISAYIVSVQMWAWLVFVDQPQQVRRIQHEQDGSKNRPLWNSTQKKCDGGRSCITAGILHAAVGSPARDRRNHMTRPAAAATSHDQRCRTMPTSGAVSARRGRKCPALGVCPLSVEW